VFEEPDMPVHPSALANMKRYNAMKSGKLFEKAFPLLAGDISDKSKQAKHIYYKQYQRQEAANAKWKKQNREVMLSPDGAAWMAVEEYLDLIRVEG
jgi:hypothetical protein